MSDEGEGSMSDDSEQGKKQVRGSYGLISFKLQAVTNLANSGLEIEEFLATAGGTYGKVTSTTLSKWQWQCQKEDWSDLMARCTLAEKSSLKKVPNWYRSVANALAVSQERDMPFPQKLGRKRYTDKFSYMKALYEDLVHIMQKRRHITYKLQHTAVAFV